MIRTLDPPVLARASGQSTQGILHGGSFKRLLTAPQIGIAPDGSMAATLELQLDQAFDNLAVVLRAAGLEATDIARVVITSRVEGAAETCAQRRTAKLAPARPIVVYREVTGFARADCLVEVECEAIREV